MVYHAVAYAGLCYYKLRVCGVRLQLAANISHIHAQYLVVYGRPCAPYAANYEVIGQYLAYVQHGEHDYLILYLGEMYLLIVQVYAALVIVDGEAAVLRLAGGRIRRAVAYVAQGYAYAGQKLRRAEGPL